MVATALGAGVGAIAERIAQARAKKTRDAKPLVAWATAGAVVAGILGLATGLIPTFMVLFPEC